MFSCLASTCHPTHERSTLRTTFSGCGHDEHMNISFLSDAGAERAFPLSELSLSSAVWRACERSRVRNITADVSSRRRAVDHQNLSFRRPAAPPATRRSTSQRRTARPTSKQTVRVDSGGLAGCSLIFNLCSLRSVGLRANLNNFVQLGDGLPRGSLTLTVGSRLWSLPPRPPL